MGLTHAGTAMYLTYRLHNLLVYYMMDAVSSTFSALADPTRRAILARLALGETTVTELAAPFAMSMPAVSKHLRVLEQAGLIARGREAQRRPCTLRAEPLRQAAGWLEEYRRYWEESFDRLDGLLRTVEAEDLHPRGKKNRKKEKKHGKHRKHG